MDIKKNRKYSDLDRVNSYSELKRSEALKSNLYSIEISVGDYWFIC